MSVKPILFNTDMVRAILDGRKTVTRRIAKYTIEDIYKTSCTHGKWSETYGDQIPESLIEWYIKEIAKPPYQKDDTLYVRETWTLEEFYDNGAMIKYRAGGELPIDYDTEGETYHKLLKFADDGWIPSIHMPKEAARIWLKVTAVRVERLNEMTASESVKEGISLPKEFDTKERAYILAFADLWDSTIKKTELDEYGWYANPWVWAIEFERCEKPESEGTI